ncbi:PTS system fructose IIA component family protein, partial [Vibrio parahaemolyticus V-223/04]
RKAKPSLRLRLGLMIQRTRSELMPLP